MFPDQIKIVKRTWKIMMGVDPDLLGDTFYSKLFTDHPEIKPLFPKDMSAQYVKLREMMTSIILKLDNPDFQEIIDMGWSQTGYGVKSAHFEMAGNAMIWMLKKGLGTEWNEQTEKAWVTCFLEIADAMHQPL
ncbi:MAG: hemoglobin [Saprospiraceae bacterium]|nr:hemoglobin [Saprospiraceae bacterium]